MDANTTRKNAYKTMWRKANVKLLPSGILAIVGATVASVNGGIRIGDFNHRVTCLAGVFIFAGAANIFIHVLSGTIYRVTSRHHLSAGRAAAVRFVIRITGNTAIFLTALDLLGVPVGKLLLGGAAIGIILGVAAQQALANLFASIVLIVAHPFYVGEKVSINSGGLGGKYIGVIKDIGLTHTKLVDDNGDMFLFPNAAILSGATISFVKTPPDIKKK